MIEVTKITESSHSSDAGYLARELSSIAHISSPVGTTEGLRSDLHIFRGFYPPEVAGAVFDFLLNNHPWPSSSYVVEGRSFTLPRKQTWHADDGIVYCYSNNLLKTRPWSPQLRAIKDKVESFLNRRFNAVLVNLYRDGDAYVGWHSDDDIEMGEAPYIASLSLGDTREFVHRPKCSDKAAKLSGTTESIFLASGDLLLMTPAFQQQRQHAVLRSEAQTSPRINLTFRYVLPRD